MKHVISALLAVGMTATAMAFPAVSNDGNNVQLNAWNSDLNAAKAKAKTLNRPVLVMMGDSVSCGQTQAFDRNILSKEAFATFVQENPLILVMLDRSQLSASLWSSRTKAYRESDGSLTFPTIVVLDPSGAVVDRFIGRGLLGASPGFYDRVQQTLDPYPYGGGSGGGDPEEAAPVFIAPTPASGATVSVTLNAFARLQISASSDSSVVYEASDLPDGLEIDEESGLISGTPTTAGLSEVTVSASNDSGSVSSTFNLKVVAGTGNLAGNYLGVLLDAEDGTVRGKLSLNVKADGTLSAQAVLDGTSSTLKGKLVSGTASVTSAGGVEWQISVDAGGNLSGGVENAELFGRRVATTGLGPFAGYYTALLSVTDVTALDDEVDNQPQGAGYLTVTVTGSGSVNYAGKLADGTSLSGSSKLVIYDGAELEEAGLSEAVAGQSYAGFVVDKTLYSARGSVAAWVWIDGGDSSARQDNLVSLMGSSWVYPGKSATFSADGFVAALDDGSLQPVGAAFVKPADLAAAFEGGTFDTDSGSALIEASGASIKLESGNEIGATLSVSRTTGVISGKFLAETLLEGTSYTARYSGVLIPALGLGGGFYLETETLDSGVKIQRSRAVTVSP